MDGWFIKEEQHASKMGNIMQSTWADFNNMDLNINKGRAVCGSDEAFTYLELVRSQN